MRRSTRQIGKTLLAFVNSQQLSCQGVLTLTKQTYMLCYPGPHLNPTSGPNTPLTSVLHLSDRFPWGWEEERWQGHTRKGLRRPRQPVTASPLMSPRAGSWCHDLDTTLPISQLGLLSTAWFLRARQAQPLGFSCPGAKTALLLSRLDTSLNLFLICKMGMITPQ